MGEEKWRFLFTPDLSPALNMAIDEAVLTLHSEGKVPPTVRFYTWNPATLSIGYFQKAKKEVNLQKVNEYGLGLVRRPTGGRAVLHDMELTYSIVVSEERMPKNVTEAYRVLSLGLLHGFQNLGLAAEMVSLGSEGEKQKYKSAGSAACFDSPSWYELVVEGRKVAGSAQTRQKGAILQHGSILLDLDVDKLFDILLFRSEKIKDRLKVSFLDKAVAINQLRENAVTLEESVEAFYRGMESGLGIELRESDLTHEEKELADQLRKERYELDSWNFKR